MWSMGSHTTNPHPDLEIPDAPYPSGHLYSWLKENTTGVIDPAATDGFPASGIQPTVLGIRNVKENAGVNAMHIVAPSQGTVDQGSVSQLSLNQSHNDDGVTHQTCLVQ